MSVLTVQEVRNRIADILITYPGLRGALFKPCGCCPKRWPDDADEQAAMWDLDAYRWLLKEAK